MLYDLSMHMGYVYDAPASGARHIIRVMPLSLPNRQRLIAGSLAVSPTPDERTSFSDFFQQTATSVYLRAAHEKFDIRMQARVQVETQPQQADLSPLLARLPDDIFNHWSLDASSPHHLIGTSPRIPQDEAIHAYALETVKPGMTVQEIAKVLCKRIHTDFTYDPKATTVDTTPSEAFKLKRGVCQDFSHVLIMALRSLGIPAGYVSGFLRTIPPPARSGWKAQTPCMPGCGSGVARSQATSNLILPTIFMPAMTTSWLVTDAITLMYRQLLVF